MKLYELTLKEAHRLLKQKEISSRELTQAVLDRIAVVEDSVGAYITVDHAMAMAQAKIADKAISQGNILPLTGIPLALKDLICTKNFRTVPDII